jgi:hypothetical protein
VKGFLKKMTGCYTEKLLHFEKLPCMSLREAAAVSDDCLFLNSIVSLPISTPFIKQTLNDR